MIKILSCNNNGVARFSISAIEELEKLNKESYSPMSMVSLCTNGKIRMFVLSGDRREWIECPIYQNGSSSIQQFYYEIL